MMTSYQHNSINFWSIQDNDHGDENRHLGAGTEYGSNDCKSPLVGRGGLAEHQRHSRCIPHTVAFSTFLLTIATVCIVAITLGLGLGLGIPRNITSIRYVTTPLLNYSTTYGVPEGLPLVPIHDLINKAELDLDTAFMTSNRSQEGATVREYTFNVTQALAAPDGFAKPMILINGQSPGPLIEASIGDTIRVHVINKMADTSTTIHWHGIDQINSTWMDGVVGVSQCGIPPGQSFTYEFTVGNQRGTFWWHAHVSVQYTDGIYGPLVIHDPDEMIPEHDDEKIVFMGDVYHTYGSVILQSYLSSQSQWAPSLPGVEPLADNLLMNGQNTYDCSIESTTFPPSPEQSYTTNCTGGQLYSTRVKSYDIVRLRLINSSSFFSFWFTVDNHNLTIVELDGVEIEPVPAEGVYVNIGQRVSVLLTADQTAGNYYMRASVPQTCFVPYAPYISAGLEATEYSVKGILSYDDVSVDEDPIGIANGTRNPFGVNNNPNSGEVAEGCDDMPFDVPVPMRRKPAVEVAEENHLYIEYMFRQAQDVNRIFVNKTAYTPLLDNATLWKAADSFFTPASQDTYNSQSLPLHQQILPLPIPNVGAQIVINSHDIMEHPWHLHGHSFQIVGWGPGLYGEMPNGTTWNLESPMRRDTVTVPALSHIVIRFVTDNPGMWALHCHVAWHMEGGMFVSIAERQQDLVRLIEEMDTGTRELSQSFCAAG